MHGPSPDEKHPMVGFPQMVYLKNVVTSPNIIVGDYTYYDDPDGPERFETRNVLYHFPFIGDKLIIGKFCAIARDARFIMNGANHKIDGVSSYPFFHLRGRCRLFGEMPIKGLPTMQTSRVQPSARRLKQGRYDKLLTWPTEKRCN